MSQFLEMLKARFADAQQRLQVATANLQKAQLEHQAVMQEFGSWQNAIAVESRREQQQQILPAPPAQPAKAVTVIATAPIVSQQSWGSSPAAVAPVLQTPPANESEVNKADLIRGVLRQHPNGITPADVWREVREQVGRAYVYSVLKRLKDRKQVAERRGKYFLQIAPKSVDESKESDHLN